MNYSDQQRIRKIYNYAVKLHGYIADKGISREELMNDFSIQWLVTTPLYNIGENAYRLSREFKEAHGEIQWSMIAGVRHRLVHDYDGTNWGIIADIVFDELPVLISQLEKLADE